MSEQTGEIPTKKPVRFTQTGFEYYPLITNISFPPRLSASM